MQSKKDAIPKLKPFYGKNVMLKDGEFYIFRPVDMESGQGDLIDKIHEDFEGSENEDEEPLDFKEYIVFGCDEVTLVDDELEIEQPSDFLALHRTSGKVLRISDGIFDSSFESIDAFIEAIEE